MNLRKTAVLSVVALLVGALGINAADARPNGGRYHGGGSRAFFYAAPLFAGAYLASRYYYPPSYYYPPAYYPPSYYYPPSPPVYIEQPAPYSVPPQSQYSVPPQSQYSVPPQSQAQPQSPAYWYYCESSQAYYPHVQSCSSGWQRVAPQAPPR